MLTIGSFIDAFETHYPDQATSLPWQVTCRLPELIGQYINRLGNDYTIQDQIAIHKTAVVEQHVVLKGPVIIGPGCRVGANAYFREGVHLISNVKIGPGSEIKSSIIFNHSAAAHFNYIGNSIIGAYVNFEAGSVVANHYNERAHKNISVLYASGIISTGVQKFGALVGDGSKIGANAVLSPGTLLEKNSIVKRLELVEQVKFTGS